MMIERIRREHSYMLRLLAILNDKLTRLKSEDEVNYVVLKELVDYLANHSETIHHPKEDILYHHYLSRFGPHAEIDNLELEHQALSEKTQAFLNLVEMILQDAVVPRDMFIDQLEDFLTAQKHHLEREETKIFPCLLDKFTFKDWQAVEDRWSVSEQDPLFGETIAEQYKQLAERVAQTEFECV